MKKSFTRPDGRDTKIFMRMWQEQSDMINIWEKPFTYPDGCSTKISISELCWHNQILNWLLKKNPDTNFIRYGKVSWWSGPMKSEDFFPAECVKLSPISLLFITWLHGQCFRCYHLPKCNWEFLVDPGCFLGKSWEWLGIPSWNW